MSRTWETAKAAVAAPLDKVDPQELRENAAVVSVLAYALATMTQKLPRKPLPLPDWMK